LVSFDHFSQTWIRQKKQTNKFPFRYKNCINEYLYLQSFFPPGLFWNQLMCVSHNHQLLDNQHSLKMVF
jgi:hypothetical protein